jgi:RNA polymerase sigma-70 factor (ECF subfamily)
MHDFTLSELERLQTVPADETLQMDHESFRALYERTSRQIWVFLWRKTGDIQLADDLLQETYYRFLRVRSPLESEAHRKNYLYRIASNLANDAYRSRQNHTSLPTETEPGHPIENPDTDSRTQQRADLDKALAQLSHRQRDALWLAYAEGSSHLEIAERLGLKVASVKLILFRARRKLAQLLRPEGKKP